MFKIKNQKESNNQLNAIVSEQLDQLNQCNKQLQSSIQVNISKYMYYTCLLNLIFIIL